VERCAVRWNTHRQTITILISAARLRSTSSSVVARHDADAHGDLASASAPSHRRPAAGVGRIDVQHFDILQQGLQSRFDPARVANHLHIHLLAWVHQAQDTSGIRCMHGNGAHPGGNPQPGAAIAGCQAHLYDGFVLLNGARDTFSGHLGHGTVAAFERFSAVPRGELDVSGLQYRAALQITRRYHDRWPRSIV
jgi:hypothetical protein